MAWCFSEEQVDASVRHDDRQAELIRKGSAKLLRALWRNHGPILRQLRGVQAVRRGRSSSQFEPPRKAIDIVDRVADAFGFERDEVIGKVRRDNYVDARATVAKLLRERNYSYPQIGVILGNRDHSTIINLVDKFDIYERRNPLVAMSYGELSRKAA